MTSGIFKPLFLVLLSSSFLLTCGIEDYPVINAIPQSNIIQVMNNRATVRIPNNYSDSPFSHFAVFYRIYVSNVPQASTTENTYSVINSVLASDYNSFRGYIDSTTHVNVNMDSLFQGRGYKYLALQDRNIFSVLGTSVLGTIVEFDFSSSRAPTMTANYTTYTLWRSDGSGIFSPQPNRLFINRPELSRAENINNMINADVVNKSGITAEERHYTYAALFIAAVGINSSTYSEIYSTPSLIHVFQLPD